MQQAFITAFRNSLFSLAKLAGFVEFYKNYLILNNDSRNNNLVIFKKLVVVFRSNHSYFSFQKYVLVVD